jgi:lipopolysaccharide/colanic/teichoic acid biosynthesis glycosyltransferase
MLLEAQASVPEPQRTLILDKAIEALFSSTRETDIYGWFEANAIVGVLFTELGELSCGSQPHVLQARVNSLLEQNLPSDQVGLIRISFLSFPEAGLSPAGGSWTDERLYPELGEVADFKQASRIVKRFFDVVGSLLALLVSSPVLLLAAIAIKLDTRGPVLFRQERVGQYGKTFQLLKFRSMRVASDSSVHKEFVRKFIAGEEEGIAKKHSNSAPVYKLTKDSRVTRVGRILRKTSLDEFPQFLNVLRGEMSLVGPRPPVPYELEAYRAWHRRRVLEIKPGVTGPWQVSGRSRTRFDDMVRLDLRYAQSWSIWLDLRILLKTPWAVLFGEGAY